MPFPSTRISLCALCIATLSASALVAQPRTTAVAPAPAAVVEGAGAVLFDQSANQTANGFVSQDFTDAGGTNDGLDSMAADDFEVPAGKVWMIDGIDVAGFFGAGAPGPVDTADIAFYSDAGSLPGAVLCSYDDVVPAAQAGGSLTLALPAPCEVAEGRAWVSVQSALPLAPNGQWFWFEVSIQRFAGFAWRNPNNGFATGCVDYTPAGSCGAADPDLAFVLRGNEAEAASELPVPTLGAVSMTLLALALALLGVGIMRRRTV